MMITSDCKCITYLKIMHTLVGLFLLENNIFETLINAEYLIFYQRVHTIIKYQSCFSILSDFILVDRIKAAMPTIIEIVN